MTSPVILTHPLSQEPDKSDTPFQWRQGDGLDKPKEPRRGFAPGEEVETWENWREYLELVSWLIPDVFRHARLKMLRVLLLSAVSVGARAAMVGTVLFYIHALNEGRNATLLGWSLPSEATPFNFLLWGSVALGFATLTVLASYRLDKLIFDMAKTYMENWTRLIMRFVAAGGTVRMPDDLQEPGIRSITRLLANNTFGLVRVVIQSLSILLPLITLLAAVTALLVTNALLTTILIPILGGYGLLMGKLNQHVIRDAQKRTQTRRLHGRDVRKMVKTLQATRYSSAAEPVWLRDYPERSWMNLAMEAFRGIVFAKKRVGYLGDLFQGVALLLILMVFGTMMATQGVSWAILLTYFLALGYAIHSLGQVSKCVTIANRFMPQARPYVAFIQTHPDMEGTLRGTSHGLDDQPLTLHAYPPTLPESLDALCCLPGEPILCSYLGPLTNQHLATFCLALAGGDRAQALQIESDVFFLRGNVTLPERPLWEYLPDTRDGSLVWDEMMAFVRSLDLEEEFQQRLGGPDHVLTAQLDEQLSSPLRFALRLMPGLVSTQKLFVLDWAHVEALNDSQRRALFAVLSNRIVLCVPGRAPQSLPEDIYHTLVVGQKCIQGIGNVEWYLRIARQYLEDYPEHSMEQSKLEIGNQDDFDDDDDE